MLKPLQPHLLCRQGDIAPYVLLPGDPGRVLRLAKLLDNYKEIIFNREYRIVTGSYQGVPVSICSTGIGGPSTAIALEELVKMGAKVLIRVGSCGANLREIKIGDVIISDSVVREDHTCLDYVPLPYPAVADREVVNQLIIAAKQAQSGKRFKYFAGLTVSVDALYSPKTKVTKNYWKQFGALAQDMEAGTVITLGRLLNVKAGAILLVVDQEGEKNIASKIARYSLEAKQDKGALVQAEQNAAKIALEALISFSKQS